MFTDRIEVENPGGLYGRITLDNLGKVGADTRNPYIASALEIMLDTENRFSGIPTIIGEMEKAGLPPPVFENQRGVFKVTLFNEIRNEINISAQTMRGVRRLKKAVDLTESVLLFCETPRSRDEIIFFTGLSGYYTMAKIVRPLIDNNRLRMTMPEKPKSPKQTYVRV